jgi:gliding motility-associated-like protein
MKTKLKLLVLFLILIHCNTSNALNITIIESQSFNSGHRMDTLWKNLVISMGHNAVVAPQTTLDNNSFFSGTDILIVSSGVITLPPNRITTILQFIQSGKPVYLQSEYLPTYSTDQAFAYLVGQLGGTFTWTNLFSGDLNPMNILGTFATTNVSIAFIGYFWYSVAGVGDCRTVNFLEYAGEYHGFQYVPFNTSFGSIITTTDQDWINQSSCPQLMQNIITHLITPDQVINGGPYVNLGNDTSICQGQTLTLRATGGTSYLWSTGSTDSSIQVMTAGPYWVQASNVMCTGTDTIIVAVNQYPTPSLGNDTSCCEGSNITLYGGVAASYLWSTASTSSFINVTSGGNYWVRTSNGNCINADTISIFFSSCDVGIEMPNVFTPNGDGSNDNFIPIKYEGIYSANLVIFNRWGEKVFSTDNLVKGWNGNLNNNICSDGTYYWIVTCMTVANESKELHGCLTLIR